MPIRANDGMERLSTPECYRLLASQRLGRIGLVVEGHPEIFPVNYALLDELIVFRTAPGTKLEHSFMESAVFEVDGTEGEATWSVVVKGIVQELPASSQLLARARRSRAGGPGPAGDGAPLGSMTISNPTEGLPIEGSSSEQAPMGCPRTRSKWGAPSNRCTFSAAPGRSRSPPPHHRIGRVRSHERT